MDSVRVRMYSQGLGDCFLITATTGGVERHALIDCGVLLGTPDATARMREVAQDVLTTTGGHLDVLAATHEHWDHVGGFTLARDLLARLSVGEVWLAWTENPSDPAAGDLKSATARGVRAATAAATALRDANGDHADRLFGVLEFFGAAAVPGGASPGGASPGSAVPGGASPGSAGGGTTHAALEWVRGRSTTVRYLRPGQTVAALGLQVYVLGPPTDRRYIRMSDPTAAANVYTISGIGEDEGFLAAAEALETGEESPMQPFDTFFRVDEEAAATAFPLIGAEYRDPDQAWRRVDHDWLGAADVLALNLDSNTNNTSLVLAFETGDGQFLLFPGDAQVGNWLSWQTVTWTTPSGQLTAPEVLARTRLYKVGHHGSHNATLRDKGLELMTSGDLVAMLPVNRETARKQRWNMPLPGLLARLEEKTKGRVLDAETGLAQVKPSAVSDAEWADFVAATTVVPGRYVDHVIHWEGMHPAVPDSHRQ